MKQPWLFDFIELGRISTSNLRDFSSHFKGNKFCLNLCNLNDWNLQKLAQVLSVCSWCILCQILVNFWDEFLSIF